MKTGLDVLIEQNLNYSRVSVWDWPQTKAELLAMPVAGKVYDVTRPPSRWAWRTVWRKLTEAADLRGLRLHDLRHYGISRLAESNVASEQTIMAIAGHVSREMLEHYSHIRQEPRRKTVAALDSVTILAQLERRQSPAPGTVNRQLSEMKEGRMVGPTRRF